jgi:hypothetical protein
MVYEWFKMQDKFYLFLSITAHLKKTSVTFLFTLSTPCAILYLYYYNRPAC